MSLFGMAWRGESLRENPKQKRLLQAERENPDFLHIIQERQNERGKLLLNNEPFITSVWKWVMSEYGVYKYALYHI